MRVLIVVLVWGLLVCCRAQGPGRVVYSVLTGPAHESADIYECALAGGRPQLLIPHQTLPAEFIGWPELVRPSGDGAYLLLRETPGVVIENPATGASRTVLGHAYSADPATERVRQIGGRYWLWSRATGTARLLTLVKADEYLSSQWLSWSPRGHTLLVPAQRQHGKATVRLLDAATLRQRDLLTVPALNTLAWTPDGTAVLVVDQPYDKPGRVLLAPLAGTPAVLTTWPRWIVAVAMSPDGQRLALADHQAAYLLTRQGRLRHTLKIIAEPPDQFSAQLQFSGTGGTLAILHEDVSGEPHIFVHQELWIANAETGTPTRLAAWNEQLGGEPGMDTMRRLLGWVPRTPALLISGRNGTSSGPATDWRRVWRQPITPGAPATQLFDSGTYVTDMGWWNGVVP